MKRPIERSLATLLVGLALAAHASAAAPVDYVRDIKPIFESRCYECHAGGEAESDLRLDTVAAAIDGGNSGPAIAPGKSSESLLLQRLIAKDDAERMPPEDVGERLSDAEIALVRAWIDAGAPAPADERPTVATKPIEHWSFQPIVRRAPPSVAEPGWVRTPLDRFILAKLELGGIEPSPEAERITLLRRVNLDLTGLPPTPAEVEEFLRDPHPDAYERQIDRLLASPHYGERWGRHWLDQARYADSDGYTNDVARSIWLYRDWVVEALNRDMPFDEFVIDQIAGDLRPEATPDQVIATGFHRNTQHNREGGSDEEQYRVDRVADRVNTTGEVLLGLTIGCARCHDHKYDPISQRDYYELFAFFDRCDEPTYPVPSPQQKDEQQAVRKQLADAEKAFAEHDAKTVPAQSEWERTQLASSELDPKLRAVLETAADQRNDEQKKAALEAFRKADPQRGPLAAEAARLKQQDQKLTNAIPTTLVMSRCEKPRTTHVHLRGNFLSPGREVSPNFPDALPHLPESTTSPTRMDLARWLVDARNPLTARVTVNRIWQVYFGLGLVETDNDFGRQGSPPTHPELLDWLAGELIARDWRMKAIHRLIVTSAVYRQSSRTRAELAEKDPRNLLLARQSRHRLSAEVIRDSALAAAGLLSTKLGGPGVYPPQPDGVVNVARDPGRKWQVSRGGDRYRRGVYTYFWRNTPHPFLKTFDAPDSNTTCTRRDRSNTPLQALMLLNDEAFFEAAQGLAARLIGPGSQDDMHRIELAFRLCLGRGPSETEIRTLAELLAAERADPPGDAKLLATPAAARFPQGAPSAEIVAWTTLARALLNLDEFITRE